MGHSFYSKVAFGSCSAVRVGLFAFDVNVFIYILPNKGVCTPMFIAKIKPLACSWFCKDTKCFKKAKQKGKIFYAEWGAS